METAQVEEDSLGLRLTIAISRKGECHVALSQKGHVAPTEEVRKLLSTVGAPGKPRRF